MNSGVYSVKFSGHTQIQGWLNKQRRRADGFMYINVYKVKGLSSNYWIMNAHLHAGWRPAKALDQTEVSVNFTPKCYHRMWHNITARKYFILQFLKVVSPTKTTDIIREATKLSQKPMLIQFQMNDANVIC